MIRAAGITVLFAVASVAAYFAGGLTARTIETRVTPKLAIPSEQLQLGTRYETTDLLHRLTITNPTGQPLTVDGVRSTCDCAVLSAVNSHPLPAGESLGIDTRLTLRIASDCQRQRGADDPVRIPVIVAYTDASDVGHEQTWAIESIVRPHLRLVQGSGRLGLQSFERPRSHAFEVAASEFVQRIDCPGTANWRVGVSPGRPDPAGPRFDITLDWRGPKVPMLLDEPVDLVPVGPDGPLPALRLDLTGEMVPDIITQPRAMLFGRIPVGTTVSDAVRVRSVSGTRLTAVSVVTPAPDGVSAQVSDVSPDGATVQVHTAVTAAGHAERLVELQVTDVNGRLSVVRLLVATHGVVRSAP